MLALGGPATPAAREALPASWRVDTTHMLRCTCCVFNTGGECDLFTDKVHAAVIAAVTYNDAFLGKENEEYCAWITDKKNWYADLGC